MSLTQEQWIEKAKQVHGNKYDYSLVEYKNAHTKIKIICPKHGEFEQKPYKHLMHRGCKKCGMSKNTSSKEKFVEKSNIIHNNKYDYSLVEYKNNSTKVKIICPEHGIFEQRPNSHLCKKGCCLCGHNITNNKTKFLKEEFVIKSNIIHNNKYNYSISEYKNCRTKIKILCPMHGEFEQKPKDHLTGRGCPKCNQSKGELKIEQWLLKNNIKYINQYKFVNCKNKHKLSFDFYLPNYNICIEFDGKQHYDGYGFLIKTENNKLLKRIKISDNIKTKYCIDNNIKLIRIPYWQMKDISEILSIMIFSEVKT